MRFDTQLAARYAGDKLDSLIERATRDTAEIVATADIPQTVAYFAELRALVKDLQAKQSLLQAHIDLLSQELIPTMFQNQNTKTITVENVGRVTVNDRWTASMVDKEAAFGWLRQTKNDGIIIETVNAQTLGAFAKEEALNKRPLPSDIFKVQSTPYTSITKS